MADLKSLKAKQQKRLEIVLSNPQLTSKITSNLNFQMLVKQQLDILVFLENKNKSNTKKSPGLIKQFEQLTNKKFEGETNSKKFEDQDELVDLANYLAVYIKNLYKLDIDQLEVVKPAKKTVETKTTEVPKENSETLKINQKPDQASTDQANPFNATNANNFFQGFPQGNFDPANNPLFLMQAQGRLKTEIASGIVYAFKTKPKAMPVIKAIVASTLFLLALVQLILAIFIFMANGYHSIIQTNEGTKDWQTSTIWNGMMYLLVTGCICFAGWWLFKPLIPFFLKAPIFKKMKWQSKASVNDNKVYGFMWQIIAALVVFFAMTLLFGMMVVNPDNGNEATIFTEVKKLVDLSTNQGIVITGLWGWYYCYIIALSMVGIVIIELVIGSIFNPRQDSDKLNALVQQYVKELAGSVK